MNIIYFLSSLLLYLFAPSVYNHAFCGLITILFLIQTIPFVIKKSKGNFINFYSLFFLSFFFTNFFYPAVLYPINPKFFSVFSYPFNQAYINGGTALAQLSASSFILGASLIKFRTTSKKIFKDQNYFIGHFKATILTIFLFILFLATVGRDFLSGNFNAQSVLSVYILQLLTCSFILSPILFFKSFQFQKKKMLFYLTALAYLLVFLSIGDRGPALSLLLLIIGLYTFYIRKISLKYLLIFGLIGAFTMHLIGLGRTAQTGAEGNVITRGIERTQSDEQFQSYLSVTQSFVVNTRNLYVGLEYVDKNGINWGTTSLLTAFLSSIPFAQSAVENLTGYDIQTSADFFTKLAFGKNPSYGLGTNLVADVYLSFGLFGSVFLFILFGWFVEFSRQKALSNRSVYHSIVYFTLLSYSIYYPRTGLFMPLKFILWTMLIYYLLKQLKIINPIYISAAKS
jgi:oligosaccharide repeat unit polymerase